MIDFALDVDGDIYPSNGDMALVNGDAQLAQNIGQALKLFKGEYFLDTDLGVPYFTDVLVKNPNLHIIRALFYRTIASVAGVKEIKSLTLDLLPSRKLSVSYVVLSANATVSDVVIL